MIHLNDVDKPLRLDLLKDKNGLGGYALFCDTEPVERCVVQWRPIDLPGLRVTNPMRYPALQAIPRRGPLDRSLEAFLANQYACSRDDAAMGARPTHCALFFGRRSFARRLVNHLARVALATVNPEILAQARRYPLKHRFRVLVACMIGGNRVLQVTHSFPLLASLAATVCIEGRDSALLDMFQEGRKLRDIADLARVPYELRYLPPSVSGYTHALRCLPGDVLRSAPRTPMAARRWARAVYATLGPDTDLAFVRWLTLRWSEFSSLVPRHFAFSYLHDWKRDTEQAAERRRFMEIVRREKLDLSRVLDPHTVHHLTEVTSQAEVTTHIKSFNPQMHAKAGLAAAHAWHRSVQLSRFRTDTAFPVPWLAGGNESDYSIEPITNIAALADEGLEMCHCCLSYADDILNGHSYIYSVRCAGARVATLEIRRGVGQQVRIAQLAGPYNTAVDKAVQRAAQRWFRKARKNALPQAPKLRGAFDDLDDDIPF